MRDIVILNCPEIPCRVVLIYVFQELCEAFKERGYTVKIVTDIKDLHNNSIIFMGDPGDVQYNITTDLLFKYAPEAVYIGWYWGNLVDVSKLKYFIFTYENYLHIKPYLGDNTVWYHGIYYDAFNFAIKQKNSCPLLLRANDLPIKIGYYERNPIRDYCYMGWIYKQDLIPTKFNGLYYATCNHSQYLSYEDRKKNYLSSHFALGFQHDTNIINGHVSQRIYEGLAYGCVVFSESLPAVEQTNGIVVYIKSKEDLEEKMQYYLDNPQEIEKKQQEAYLFIKKYGTNQYAIDKFIKVIKDCFDIEI
jgi:hypothetical protein